MTERRSRRRHPGVAAAWMRWWRQVAAETEVGEPGDRSQ